MLEILFVVLVMEHTPGADANVSGFDHLLTVLDFYLTHLSVEPFVSDLFGFRHGVFGTCVFEPPVYIDSVRLLQTDVLAVRCHNDRNLRFPP